MSDIRIAVIVPYYPDNSTAPLFNRCIESISSRFHVYTAIDNEHYGVADARNRGLERALEDKSIDYVTFLDADDTFNVDAYEQMCEAIAECPEADIIQMNHQRQKEGFEKWVKYFNTHGYYELDCLPSFWFAVWNKLYKASLLEDICFEDWINYGEDEVFNLECLTKARRIYCSERFAMTHHFDNPNSLTKTLTLNDIMNEQMTLQDFVWRHTDDTEMLSVIRQRQIELWSSSVYKQFFGGVS